ncbi:5251_t:CDS:2 [Diversispora eburnea]|uniref:5251_t:CDS:1 n=1 Tax=Diversispora eburnea TaxID=1213867 RepID=A0A9N8WER3_9GLOM|nr:5251_t:CDS:2 [Diversispora eburnea]
MPTKLINLEIHKIKIRSVPKQLWLEPVKQESGNENEIYHKQQYEKYEHEKHKHKQQHKKNEYNNNNDSNVQGWTCGNLNIDKLIKNSQLQSSPNNSLLEWIPYNRFSNIQYLGQGGFSTVYSALWNNHSQTLRTGPKKFETSLVCRNLQSYIRNNFNDLTWLKKLEILLDIARGIHSIHRSGLCHKNLHTSNLFYDNGAVLIGDLGLTGYANKVCEYSKEAAGMIQYMGPEILRGKPYTKFADIYGFAMIMSEIASVDSLLKWYKEVRDNNTSSDIYKQFKAADEYRQRNLQIKIPLYKYDKYKSQIVETTDLGEEDCLADESGESSDEGYYGYGADFPALLVHESEYDSGN